MPTQAELKIFSAWLASLLRKPKPPHKGHRTPPTSPHPAFRERFGLDWAGGALTPRQMHKVGASFACRYLSTVGNPKNLGKRETKMLRRGGIDIVTVFETTAREALSGFDAGRRDALSAERQIRALGGPADRAVIFFAVDDDVNPRDVHAYFLGTRSVLSRDRNGVYGSYRVVAHLMSEGLCEFGWQTYAWSGGAWYAPAQLRQFSNGHNVFGVDTDFNRATTPVFGQWPKK